VRRRSLNIWRPGGPCALVQHSAAYWLKGCNATLLGAASACQGRATAAIRPTNTPSRMVKCIVAYTVQLRRTRLAMLRFAAAAMLAVM
jgi:hypothetical protein